MSEYPCFGTPDSTANFLKSGFLILLLLVLAGCGGASGPLTQSASSNSATLLAANPSQIDFGSVTPNSGASRTLVLTNNSANSVAIRAVQVNPGSVFRVVGWNGLTILAPQQSIRLQVKFSPPSNGAYSAAVTVLSMPVTSTNSLLLQVKDNLRQRSSAPHDGVMAFINNITLSGKSGTERPQHSLSISVSPASTTLQVGQSQQFAVAVTGGQSSVTWTAALGTISSSGLYSPPHVSTTTTDTVSASLTGGQYAQATVTVQPLPSSGNCPSLGNFSETSPPPACWVPYSAASPFNHQVPANPKLDPNSANEIARLMVGPGGTLVGSNFASTPYSVAETTEDFGHPVYFSTASDPVYKITSCYYTDGSTVGMTLHMPTNLRPAGGNDGHSSVVDQTTGIEFDFYDGTDGVNGSHTGLRNGPPPPSNNDCGGTCTDLPGIRGCGHVSVTGNGLGRPTTTAAGYGLMAGQMRPEDFLAGSMEHALTALVDCTSGYVYPSAAPGLDCVVAGDSRGDTYALPMGAHLWLDYTDAQIDAMNLKPWEKTMVRAIAHYGIYLVDTSGLYGNDGMSLQFESGEPYFVNGLPQPMAAVAASNGIPLSTWPNGTHYYRFTPNASVIDWAHHLHVLAPCVAQGTC